VVGGDGGGGDGEAGEDATDRGRQERVVAKAKGVAEQASRRGGSIALVAEMVGKGCITCLCNICVQQIQSTQA
jgi:hypothetical protein